MTRILLQSASDHLLAYYDLNLGAAALTQCAVATLREYLPEVEIVSRIKLSPRFALENNIRVVTGQTSRFRSFSLWEAGKHGLVFSSALLWRLLGFFGADMAFLRRGGILKEYHACDIVVDLSADRFHDAGIGILPVLEHAADVLLGRIMGKPW
jgi:hypothetical protein